MCTGALLLPHLISFLPLTPPTEIYTLSLHDALPIFEAVVLCIRLAQGQRERPEALEFLRFCQVELEIGAFNLAKRSEEHTSELQSRGHLVCRLLLEKKKRRKRLGHQARRPGSAV